MLNTVLFMAIGMAAGVLSGLFGIGGGVIIVPALMYLTRFDQLTAQGTSLMILLPPTGLLAVLQYYRRGNVNIQAAVVICVFLVLGSVLGARVSHDIPIRTLKTTFGVFMLLISLKMIFSN